MSLWAHLKRDKLIALEFFDPACTTSARLLDGPSMEKKALNMKYFLFRPTNSTTSHDPSCRST